MPPEIARVVEHEVEIDRLARTNAPRADQLRKQLAVMDHFVLPAEIGVLVLEGVVAMRARGDDLLHGVAAERLDVGGYEHLE